MGVDRDAALTQAVQANCHIADARHAGDMTLCTYLLQMRELYRWEHGLAWQAALPRAEIGNWIAAREALWSAVEDRPLVALPCAPGAAAVDPFDVATVNRALQARGLFYGAGLVGAGRPVFFLAERHAQGHRDGVAVSTAGRELARGLMAPPAMLAPGGDGDEGTAEAACIIVRRESLARWCWERYEAFSLRPQGDTAFHAVVRAYGLDLDFAAALPRWLDEQTEALTLHELGEHRVGARLGADWAALRLALPGRRTDLYLRALRDILADLDTTLPTLLERDAQASLHAWFANFDGVRQLLFPALDSAYKAWRQGDGGQALRGAIDIGTAHFSSLAEQVLALHRRGGPATGAAIEGLMTAPSAPCTI